MIAPPLRPSHRHITALGALVGMSLLSASAATPFAYGSNSGTPSPFVQPPSNVTAPSPWPWRPGSVPPSIPADCSVDVTSELQSWIDSVPDGSVLTFAGGCYRIEGTLQILDRNGLTFEGNGTTFKATTVGAGTASEIQNRAHFFVKGGSNVVFRNLMVQGVNFDHAFHTSYAGQHAFSVSGVTNLLIDSVTVHEVYGDFLTVSPDTYRSWRWSSGVTLQNCTCDFAGRQGVSVTGGQHVIFQNNHLYGFGQSAFDIEPDGRTYYDATGFPTDGGADDVRFVNNEVGGPIAGIFFSAAGYPANVDNVLIDHNNLHGVSFTAQAYGFEDVRRRNYTLTNNTSDLDAGGPYGSPVRFSEVDGATVSGNTIITVSWPHPYVPAVTLWASTGVSVTNNAFPGAGSILLVDPPIDPPANTQPWTGSASSNYSECGNTYGLAPDTRSDSPC